MVLHILALIAVALYGLASIGYVRRFLLRSLPVGYQADAVLSHKSIYSSRLLLNGILVHALFLIGVFSMAPSGAGLQIRFPLMLSILSLTVLVIFQVMEKAKGWSVLGAFVAPIGTLLMVFSGLIFHRLNSAETLPEGDIYFYLHLIFSIAADVLLIGAGVVGLALILQEKRLKRKIVTDTRSGMPSLVVLDLCNRGLTLIGFLAMVFGAAWGIAFANSRNIPLSFGDIRLLSILVAILFYGGVTAAMFIAGTRGRRAAWASTLGLFVLLISLFIGGFAQGGLHGH